MRKHYTIASNPDINTRTETVTYELKDPYTNKYIGHITLSYAQTLDVTILENAHMTITKKQDTLSCEK